MSCDIMAGFPEEEDKDFKNSIDSLKETIPVKIYISPYSSRKGEFSFPSTSSLKILSNSRLAALKSFLKHCL